MKEIFRYFIVFIMGTHLSTCYAQTRDEMLEEFMREREKMLTEVTKMFQEIAGNDSFFSDDLTNRSQMQNSSIEIKQTTMRNGDIAITIIPKSKDINIDIKTKNRSIIISAKTQTSSVSKTISIPQGYTANTPKSADKRIQILLVPLQTTKKWLKPGTVPIRKKKGEDSL